MSKEIYEFVDINEEEDNENYEYFYEDVIVDENPPSIALCILSAINVGIIKSLDDLEELCDLAVRALEEIIDYQNYPILAAEKSTKARRSLGVGFIGLAHYLAKKKVQYSDSEAWKLTHDLSEAFQYYLLKASNTLAQERGACEGFAQTKYAHGILPIDTYKKDVDAIVPNVLNYDWEALRHAILEHGLRHSTLSAQMPSESSSVVSNATNGIEPPRGYLSVKKSKKGPLKQIVPQYQSLKNYYTLLWDMPSNEGYINVVAAMQKFFDQGISGNWSYNPTHFENNEVPMSVIIKDLLTTYKLGWKTSYYLNTYDYKTDPSELLDDEQEYTTAGPASVQTPEPHESDEDSCDSCAI